MAALLRGRGSEDVICTAVVWRALRGARQKLEGVEGIIAMARVDRGLTAWSVACARAGGGYVSGRTEAFGRRRICYCWGDGHERVRIRR